MTQIIILIFDCYSGNPIQQKKEKILLEENTCNLSIMRSYLLKGKRRSSLRQSIICPNIKKNCCTRFDEQRAFITVNQVLPGRILEYREKIASAFVRIKNLHKEVTSSHIQNRGTRERRAFCAAEDRKLLRFSFLNFYETVIQELIETKHTLDTHYSSFYCLLCDGRNHDGFMFRENASNLIVDSTFCHSFLTKNQKLIAFLNVDFVSFMITLQNVIDCRHYQTSFNLRFFDSVKRQQMLYVSKCFSFINSANFITNCKSVCDRINFANIVDLIEGDFDFMVMAANIFEKYLHNKEVQTFVSNDLRAFFKSFLMKENKSIDMEENGEDDDFNDRKLKIEYEKPLRKANLPSKSKRQKNRGHRKLNLAKKLYPTKKSKRMSVKSIKLIKTKKTGFIERKLEEKDWGESEMASDYYDPSISQALHTNKPDSKIKLPNESKPEKQTKNSAFRKGKFVYSPDLMEAYERINIDPINKGIEPEIIYTLQNQPIFIDKAKRLYDVGKGLNPEMYLLEFNMPINEFYKSLFSYRKPEKKDVKLTIFLTDFTDEYKTSSIAEIYQSYDISPKDWTNSLAKLIG